MPDREDFGPYADFEGEYSDFPAVAIGTDDLINSLTALSFPVKGFITSNKSRRIRELEKEHDNFHCFAINDYMEERCGNRYHFPVSNKELEGAMVGKDDNLYHSLTPEFREDIEDFLGRLQDDYGTVFANLYQNSSQSTQDFFDNFPEIIPLVPDYRIRENHGKKTEMYKFAKDLGIPVVEGEIADGFGEAADIVDSMSDEWEHGAFLSYEKGAGGDGSFFAEDSKSVRRKCYGLEGEFLVLRRIPEDKIEKNPNDLHLRCKDKTILLSVTDQRMDGVRHKGNDYPLDVDGAIDEIRKYAKILGNERAEEGYRGLAGNDWMWTDDNTLYFVESNERKNRSTTDNAIMLEQSRDPSAPPVSYLEALAVMEDEVPFTEEDYPSPGNFPWSMEVYKKDSDAVVFDDINTPIKSEFGIFKRKSVDGQCGVFSRPQQGTIIPSMNSISKSDMSHEARSTNEPQDVCRIVAAGRNREEVKNQISEAKEEISDSIKEV